MPIGSSAQLRSRLLGSTDFVGALHEKVATGGRLNVRNLIDSAYALPGMGMHLIALNLADSAPGGNNNGYANPGETVTVRPAVVNAGTAALAGATIEIVVSHPGVTVVGPSTLALGTANPYQAVQAASAFQLQLSAGVPDLEQVQVQFIIHSALGDQTVADKFYTVRLLQQTQVDVSFRIGEIVADPVRNLVYVVDVTGRRILAIDTDLGRKVDEVQFTTNAPGQMTVSLEGDRLFLAGADGKLEVFSLPDLTPLQVIELPGAAAGLAHGVNNRLYFGLADEQWSPIYVLDVGSGQIVGTLDDPPTNLLLIYGQKAQVHTNRAGTRLFVGDTQTWPLNGTGYVFEYDISGAGLPVYVGETPFRQEYVTDFSIDEQYQRLYTLNYGMSSLQATNLITDERETWRAFPGAHSGTALALLPDSPVVYSASESSSQQQAVIHRHLRSDGTPVGEYFSTIYRQLDRRALAITPNGKLVYAVAPTYYYGNNTYSLGILGGSSLQIDAVPAFPSVTGIWRNDANPINNNVNFTVSFNKPIDGFQWSSLRLVTTGTVAASFYSISYLASGAYEVAVSVTSGDGTLGLELIDDDSLHDPSGNPLGGPGAGNGSFTTGQVYTIDRTPPQVQSLVRGAANASAQAVVPFTLTFNEDMKPLDAADFSLTTTGLTGASIASVTAVNKRVYTVQVNTGTGNGTVRLNLLQNGTVRDLAGNGATAFSSGETYTIVKDAAPFVVARPAAAPATTNTTTTALSVLGSDDDLSENDLTYTWSVSSKPQGAADPTYSVNGTNAAKNTIATFSKAGTYTFVVMIRDPQGLTATDTVNVIVTQKLTSITIDAPTNSVASGAPLTLTPTARDQFGDPVAGYPPQFTWSIDSGGVGALNTNTFIGHYRAPQSGGGSAVIRASTGGVSGSFALTVNPAQRAVSIVAEADAHVAENSGTNFGNSGYLYVLDENGESYDSYLRLNLAGITGPIDRAVLRLMGVTGNPPGTAEFRVELVANDTWSESGLNWNNRPASTTLLGAWTGQDPLQSRELDLTAAVANELANDPSAKLSLRIYIPSGQGALYAAREIANAWMQPQIVIYQPAAAGSSPVITSPPQAAANPATTASTTLSVRATDDGGAANLAYTWSVVAKPSGAANPTFSPNGTNGAQDATVTFSAAGTYTLRVTVTDQGGQSTSSETTVAVQETVASVVVAPNTASVVNGLQKQFTASAYNQFGQALASPALTWTIDAGGLGTVSATGLYTAPASGVGAAVVRTAAGGVSGTAGVTVIAVGMADRGFEAPEVGNDNWNAFQYTPSGSAWTFTGQSGLTGNQTGFTQGNPNAPEGDQVAFLQNAGQFSQAQRTPRSRRNKIMKHKIIRTKLIQRELVLGLVQIMNLSS